MKVTVNNAVVYTEGRTLGPASVLCDFPVNEESAKQLFSDSNSQYGIFPGFCDVHVHFREPGFSYKETIRTGSLAAAKGGYTDVCTMPNLNPVPDSVDSLILQENMIKRDAVINVHPLAAVTIGEKGEALSDIEALSKSAIAFSDDGKGIQSESMMRSAMEKIRGCSKILCAHCEDESLLQGGYIHLGDYAAAHSHRGICSQSEWRPIERDLRLAKETGCAYHVCHISCKESVELIRQAKKEGVNVTCETAPHYLLLTDSDLQEDGRFKMNPPIRGEADREALLEGIADGTIDMIATDHAPHSREEKSRGLRKSLMGVTGLECAFPVLYTELVKKQGFDLGKLIELMSINPRKRFKIKDESTAVWRLSDEYTINPEELISMGKSTPFEGRRVFGRCILTVVKGEAVWMK